MTKNKKALHFHEKKMADQDYWHKLTEHQKEWLAQFNKEYYQAIYSEEEREIHIPKYDEELKSSRSARRKDIFDNPKADIIITDMEDYLDEEPNDLQQLEKIDEGEAIAILREQAKDSIINEIDTLENILSDLQRDSIKIFLNARKNK